MGICFFSVCRWFFSIGRWDFNGFWYFLSIRRWDFHCLSILSIRRCVFYSILMSIIVFLMVFDGFLVFFKLFVDRICSILLN